MTAVPLGPVCPGWLSSQQVLWSRGREDTSSSHPASTLSCWDCGTYTTLPAHISLQMIWVLHNIWKMKREKKKKTYWSTAQIVLENGWTLYPVSWCITRKWWLINTRACSCVWVESDAGREQQELEQSCCSWLSDINYVTGRRSKCTKHCWAVHLGRCDHFKHKVWEKPLRIMYLHK